MDTINELIKKEIVVFGAGKCGIGVRRLLKMAGFSSQVIISDTYKTGFDEEGLPIIRPAELKNHLNSTVIIGISEHLRPQDVDSVIANLKSLGFHDAQIIMHSTFLSLFGNLSENTFNWQSSSDDIYDWNANIYLIEQLSKYIEKSDLSVVDLGAGGMNLEKFISSNVTYTPVDFKSRCDKTIVCDFNKGQYPNIYADVYVLCAMLYFIDNPKKLLEECAKFANNKIIVALNGADLSKYPEIMHTSGFKNYMFFDEIAQVLTAYEFAPSIDVTLHRKARRFVVYEKKERMFQ